MRKRRKFKLVPVLKAKIRVTIVTDRNATVAHLDFRDFGAGKITVMEMTGSAKREQGDEFSEVIAVQLALGRALGRMSRQLTANAHRRVAEATRQQKDLAERRRRKNARKLTRPVAGKPLLPIDTIRRERGDEAAEKAAARRAHSI